MEHFRSNQDRLLWECIHNQTGLLPTIISELADLSGPDIVKAVDCTGRNALHLLCIHNRTPYLLDGIEALIWRGADVNATDLDSRNALHLLCAHNPTGLLAEIVYIFKHHGLDINAKDRDGRNVLHLLCQNIFIRCFRSAHERNLLWLGGYYLFKNPDGMEQLKSLFSVHSTRTDVVRMTHFYRPSMSWRYEYVLKRGENNLEEWLDLSDPKRSLSAILISLKEVDVNEKDANELNALQLLY